MKGDARATNDASPTPTSMRQAMRLQKPQATPQPAVESVQMPRPTAISRKAFACLLASAKMGEDTSRPTCSCHAVATSGLRSSRCPERLPRSVLDKQRADTREGHLHLQGMGSPVREHTKNAAGRYPSCVSESPKSPCSPRIMSCQCSSVGDPYLSSIGSGCLGAFCMLAREHKQQAACP